MKFTFSVRKADSTDSEFSEKHGSSRFNILAAFVFAATLALAPLPAFAQHGGGGGSHGGGGGGGGSHGGGFGGGGSHSSGAGSAHGSSAPASHPAGSGATSGATSGGGHWWNPFHASSTSSSAQPAGSNTASSEHATTAERFAGNNNTWQEPPTLVGHGSTSTGAKNALRGGTSTPRSAIASPPHIPVPRRPIRVGPYYPFHPFFPYGGFGFGFGFGGFGYGAFGPCDPFWGCYGYGYGYGGGGIGYGYYGGSFSSDNGYGADLSYSGGQDTTPSQEPNPSLFAQAPETSQDQQTGTAGPTEKHVVAVLYLKNGSSYAVTDYWLADGKVHYVTSYGGENAVDESDLDLQRTVDENAAQGLTFTLRPGPVVPGGAVVVPQ
jgi:hypothetical protein